MHKDIEEKVLMKKKQSTSTLNLACHFAFLRADVSVLKLEIEYPISIHFNYHHLGTSFQKHTALLNGVSRFLDWLLDKTDRTM